MTDTQADLTQRARAFAAQFYPNVESQHHKALADAAIAFAQSEREAAAAEIAKLTDERDDARFHVRDMVATNAAMAAEWDRAKNNLEHWRQEVGKLHSEIARLEAAAAEARRAALRHVAKGLVPLYRKDQVEIARLCDEELDRTGNLLGWLREEAALASPAPQEETR